MTAPVDLSVIICTRNRPELLAAALGGLAGRGPEVELIVVDSASDGPETERVARAADAIYVRCDRPGLSLARNRGVATATADLVAFTDDDCVPDPTWADAVRAGFADDRIGLVTGPIRADREARLATSINLHDEPMRLTAQSDPFEIGHGANMAFRRQALIDGGPFDEVMGPGAPFQAAEDIDLMRRVLGAGWEGIFDVRVSLSHTQWRTTREALRTYYRYGIGAGAFAAKLERVGGTGRSVVTVRSRLWDASGKAIKAIRTGHQTAVLANLVISAGIVAGARRARRLPVEAELFVSRPVR